MFSITNTNKVPQFFYIITHITHVGSRVFAGDIQISFFFKVLAHIEFTYLIFISKPAQNISILTWFAGDIEGL